MSVETGLYFWNRWGEIACDRHRPSRLSDTWKLDGWTMMGPTAALDAQIICNAVEDHPVSICDKCREPENMARGAWGDR